METQPPAAGEIAHRTAVEITALRGVVTAERFKELTGGVQVEDLSQAVGAEISAHLRKMNDYYSDFNNIIIAANEKFAHPAINPRGVAFVVPELIDRLSRDLWPK